MGQPRYQLDGDQRTSGPGFGLTLHPASLDVPLRWKKPRLIFVNSMSDLFHQRVPVDYIRKVFSVIERTPQHTYQLLTKRSQRLAALAKDLEWPSNLWVGVTIESDAYSFRADHLRRCPAAVRFLSCEPMLGSLAGLDLNQIDWVIVGGESGAGARLLEPTWAIELRDRCNEFGVPFFFKQWGGLTPKARGRMLEGRHWDEMPVRVSGELQVTA